MLKRACALFLVLTHATAAAATPHVVPTSSVDANLATDRETRARDLAELRSFLATDAARLELAALHVDGRVVDARLESLDAGRLHALAEQTRAHDTKPRAHHRLVHTIVINILVAVGILAVVAVLFVLLGGCATCGLID
jgi:hypothetical protein